MVEILRNKWCEDLEDILQCPICMMCPINAYIYQCIEGHHICRSCLVKLPSRVCPSCGKNWTSFRNRVAEDLCKKFDEIKLSLIDPEDEINKLLIPDKFCASTQTDNLVEGPIMCAGVVDTPIKPLSDPPSGVYPCCIGSCEVKMCFEPLMRHIKSEHLLHFVELSLEDGLLFKHSWSFNYMDDLTVDRVFLIRDVGAFILKLSTDKCGDLTGYVVMLHSGFISKLFTYQLRISCGAEHCPPYTGDVNSCRAPAAIFGDKSLRVKSAHMREMGEYGGVFKCSLLLARKMQLDESQPLKATGQKKRRMKNRNKNARATAGTLQSTSMTVI